jgi:hypothetical protein
MVFTRKYKPESKQPLRFKERKISFTRWWPMVSRLEVRNLLQSLQGSYPRVAVGSMKTTPTEVLEVALCLNPLDLAVTGSARFTAYRLNYQGEWRNTGLGHTKLEFFQKYPLKLAQDQILKNISW